ncbi:hydrolase [Arthrobacter phage Persistence]|uniref:Hydrolase n=1 Tax=Arthrobacter phage Persistence TaxID=2836007 RepID=A0A8F3IM10_9CAUD|nr:hydrolase [Arthrobacter phage Persistence]QWY79661.1 hydrolase [Arthrobacter phage Persistence]
MANRIQYRRDTAAAWVAANPVLALGEPAYETDTKKRKIGDGSTAWNSLGYQPDAATVAAKLDVFGAVEAVPFINFGDSYGNGSQGADQASRPFNRLSVRWRTGTINGKAVAGTRMDEIATAVKANWTPNGRGLVGFSDGVINDEKQYGDLTGISTTVEAFRSALAYLTARAVNDTTTAAFSFGTGWTTGTTSTVGSTVDFAFTGATGYLLVNFVTATGGVFTIKNGAGTTVATVNTGGYKQNFTGAVKLTGNASTGTTYRATLSSGTMTVVGVAATSPYPPIILWDKPGQFSADATEYNRMKAYLDACSAIAPDFPTLIQVDAGSGWDYTTMISEDGVHRNDPGNLFVANRIQTELSNYLAGGFKQGLNRLNQGTGAAAAYTIPTPDYSVTYSADSFDRANSSTLGTTTTGGYAWTTANPANWSIASNQLTVNSTASTAPNDCLINDGQSDGTITVTKADVSASGIAFRISADGLTGYLLYKSGSAYQLAKRTGAAAYTNLVLTSGITPASGDVIKIVLNGSSIVVKVNGATAITTTDASYAGTRHGLWANSGVSGAFDNWSHTNAIV